MLGLRTTRYGSSLAWDYDWAAMGGGKSAFTKAELDEAIKHYTSIPDHWKRIVEDRRKECIAHEFSDSKPKSTCTIHRCVCGQQKTCETQYFEFDQKDREQCLQMCGDLGHPKPRDQYWEMPEDMPEEEYARISVRTDYFDAETGAVDARKREERRESVRDILDSLGVVILVGFFALFGELFTAAEDHARGSEFPNSVLLNCPRGGKHPDHGDETKRITPGIDDDDHPVAKALARVAEEYLPCFVVARGVDTKGEDCTERSVLNQVQVEHHKRLRDAGILRTVHQVLHTDKEMYSSASGSNDPEDMNRQNLAKFVSGRGPVSIWVPVPKDDESISLVGYLGSNKPALSLWVYMARHYAPMKQAYMHNRTNPTDKGDTFERAWIGAARLFLQREHPGEQIRALRILAKRLDAVLMHGLFAHGGTDEVGLRLFACYSCKVRFTSIPLCEDAQRSNSVNRRLSSTSATWYIHLPTALFWRQCSM
jgi:hypothetical protein